jgi:hypothetical protein
MFAASDWHGNETTETATWTIVASPSPSICRIVTREASSPDRVR